MTRRSTSRPSLSLSEALDDPALLAPLFEGPSWDGWRSLLRAFEARPPRPGDLARFAQLTGRASWPTVPAEELWIAAGRRSGKSRMAAAIAVHRAVFVDHRPFLAPGERAVSMLLAGDRAQARVAMQYARGLLRSVPMLEALIEREAAESIDLTNGATIEIHTSSFRATRGYTLACVVADEVAFWRGDESSWNPAEEILQALRPALVTLPGAPLICISTPYSRSGPLFAAIEKHHGRDDDPVVLTVQAETRTLNPSVAQAIIDRALEEDPEAAQAEYLGQFRSDLESYVDRDTVLRCVIPGRGDLPRQRGVQYVGFCDPSGGRADSFTLAIAHRERDTAVIDLVRERKAPLSPDSVTAEFAALCKSFGLVAVTGDKYAAGWVEERFSVYGIRYDRAPLSKSDLYSAALPQLLSKRVELPEAPTLITQLCTLERRTSRGTGRDSIDHSPGARDDVANACMGAVHLVAGRRIARAVSFDLTDLMTGHAGCPKWWPRDWPASWYWEGRPRRESGR